MRQDGQRAIGLVQPRMLAMVAVHAAAACS
jgi:hypothetical protein